MTKEKIREDLVEKMAGAAVEALWNEYKETVPKKDPLEVQRFIIQSALYAVYPESASTEEIALAGSEAIKRYSMKLSSFLMPSSAIM